MTISTHSAQPSCDELGSGHVYRVAPHHDDPDLLPPSREGGILGNRSLTFSELEQQFAAGARLATTAATASDAAQEGRHGVPLFAVTRAGRLSIAADGRPPDMRPGDTVIALVPADARRLEA